MKQIGSMAGKLILLLGAYFFIFKLQELLMAQYGSYRSMLENNVPVWLLINFSALYLLLLAAFGIRNRFLKTAPRTLFEAAGFRAIRGSDIALSLVIGLGGALVFIGMMKFAFLPQTALDQMKAYVDIFGNAERFVFVLIGVGLAGAFMEEIFFRGLVFNQLRRMLPMAVAFVLQAVIYAIFQPNITISFISFFLALMYGFVYLKTGSVWSTITIAVTVNTAIVFANAFGVIDQIPQGSSWAYAVWLAGLAFMIAGLAGVARRDPSPVQSAGKLRPYFVMLGRLALYIGIYFGILQTLVYLWYSVLTQIDAIRPWLTDSKNGNWGLVLNDFIAIPVYYLLLRRYQSRNLIQISRFRRIPLRTVWQIAALSVFMGLWVTCVARIHLVADTFPQFEALFGSLVGGLPVTFIVFLIVHSIYKEVLFRGLVFNELHAVLPLGLAILGNAVIYGLLFFQLDPALTFYGGMGTVIFVLLYLWYGSIWASITAEIGLFATYYIARGLLGYWESAFNAGFVAVIAICSLAVPALMYRLWKQKPQAESRTAASGHIQLEAGGS